MTVDFTTHLAAIGVGVVIALYFVGGSKNNEESEPAAKAAPAKANGATPSKKKNKKKNKKKSAAAKAEPAAVAAPVAKKKAAPAPAPKPAPVPAPAPAPVKQQSAGGKKKKNKNKKNGAAAAAAAPAPAANGAAKAAPAPAPKPAPPAPAPAPAAPAVTPFQTRLAVDEEEWATIPKKSKKKRNTFKQQEAASGGTESTKVSVTVTINASRVGIIIGPKGATMLAIQEKTGTKLDVNAPKLDEKAAPSSSQFRPVVGGKSKSTAKATVVITDGSAEGQQAAKKAILELADRGYATLLQAEGFGESSVGVHPRFLSEVVGTGGKIIKAIQSELDVKLTIPKTDWTPKTLQVGNIEPSVRVGIAGDSPANVKQTKQVIKDICAYHHHEITHPGLIHQEVYVPSEFFHCVIGSRGCEIKHIRGNYMVDVYMPSNESWCVTENVICVGKPNDVEKAISYIKLLMDRDTELREQKYSDEGYGDELAGW